MSDLQKQIQRAESELSRLPANSPMAALVKRVLRRLREEEKCETQKR